MYNDEKQALDYLIEASDRASVSFDYDELFRRSGAKTPRHMDAILESLSSTGFITNLAFLNGKLKSYCLTLDAYHIEEALRRRSKEDRRWRITTGIAILALIVSFFALFK